VRVISKKRLREFWEDPKRPKDARALLTAWYKTTVLAAWRNFAELKQTFPSADRVGNCVVFDVGNNRYRLIGRVLFANDKLPGVVYVLRVMDHAEYDENKWPDQCGCHNPPPPAKGGKVTKGKPASKGGKGTSPSRQPKRR
jgi:mRNA interferase HigB